LTESKDADYQIRQIRGIFHSKACLSSMNWACLNFALHNKKCPTYWSGTVIRKVFASD